MASEPCVTLREVTFAYDSFGPTLSRMDLEVSIGEAFGMIGPAGSGKTTVLKILAGVLNPTAGARVSRARLVGMAFQKGALFDSMTTADNVRFPLKEVLGLPKEEIESRVNEALGEVGLEGSEHKAINELSGGMQKRLSLARALALRPDLLLLDDPTAGLDPITSRQITQLILNARRRYHFTLAVVSSDPTIAFMLCDRVGLLYEGRFLAMGTSVSLHGSEIPIVKQFVNGLVDGPLTEMSDQAHDRS